MVFGNKGDTSGSGVAFSRDEITGAHKPSGDYLPNAQGEDVVSGLRDTHDISELRRKKPGVHAQLIEILDTLERHYKDMQDVEFTVEEGVLYMLQTRSAKRPAQAAVRVAVDMVREGTVTKAEALDRMDAANLEALMRPSFDPRQRYKVIAEGVAASPGAAKGEIVFTAADAVKRAHAGHAVVLVREFTEADDVAGFHAAQGILTSKGGKASHAALVARGMGKPCVAGASELQIEVDKGVVRANGRTLRRGDLIAIDGTTGRVTTDDVPLIEPQLDQRFRTVLKWADEFRQLGVRANADSPDEARRARDLGAEGIGLCRTEHMFMEADRLPKMRRMILARDERARRRALDQLLPLQRRDFEGIFRAMKGLPVTIRLLDPPLHEFLPKKEELVVKIDRLERGRRGGPALKRLRRDLQRLRDLEETNPMLGTRGCRLGIVFPEIYEMQVRAIVGAAVSVRNKTRSTPRVEIMIPLVDYERELEAMRRLVDETAEQTIRELRAKPIDYAVGTMIELPRACLIADKIARHADFFSFGTNDLTQTVLGFSRDDIESTFLARYIEQRILDRSPFETIDVPGVGSLVKTAVKHARAARPDIKLGICGEHGGDPQQRAVLRRRRPGLRELLAVPGAGRPRGGRAGRDPARGLTWRRASGRCGSRWWRSTTRDRRTRRSACGPTGRRWRYRRMGWRSGCWRSSGRCHRSARCAAGRPRCGSGCGARAVCPGPPCSTASRCGMCASCRRRARSRTRHGDGGPPARSAARSTSWSANGLSTSSTRTTRCRPEMPCCGGCAARAGRRWWFRCTAATCRFARAAPSAGVPWSAGPCAGPTR